MGSKMKPRIAEKLKATIEAFLGPISVLELGTFCPRIASAVHVGFWPGGMRGRVGGFLDQMIPARGPQTKFV